MQFKTTDEVKRFFRGIPLIKREISLKIDFYQKLIVDNLKINKGNGKHTHYYREQIEILQKQLRELMPTVDKLLDLLEPEERLVITAKYLNSVNWDNIERLIYYSRRQAIRIHNRAIKRLVNKEF